jgi:hypothetical protein
MSNTVHVVWPTGTKTDGEPIYPAEMTGRQSGNQIHVRLEIAGLAWSQWVHIDNVLFEDEVVEV